MGPCTSHYLTLLCLLQQTAEGYDHSVVTKELKVSANGQYTIFALGQIVTNSHKESTPTLADCPEEISPDNLTSTLMYLAGIDICCGNGVLRVKTS